MEVTGYGNKNPLSHPPAFHLSPNSGRKPSATYQISLMNCSLQAPNSGIIQKKKTVGLIVTEGPQVSHQSGTHPEEPRAKFFVHNADEERRLVLSLGDWEAERSFQGFMEWMKAYFLLVLYFQVLAAETQMDSCS